MIWNLFGKPNTDEYIEIPCSSTEEDEEPSSEEEDEDEQIIDNAPDRELVAEKVAKIRDYHEKFRVQKDQKKADKLFDKIKKEISNFFDVNYCLLTNSWTNGALATLMALGIKKGDEVIIPAMTFVATANVIEILGAKPRFVDVDPKTYLAFAWTYWFLPQKIFWLVSYLFWLEAYLSSLNIEYVGFEFPLWRNRLC